MVLTWEAANGSWLQMALMSVGEIGHKRQMGLMLA